MERSLLLLLMPLAGDRQIPAVWRWETTADGGKERILSLLLMPLGGIDRSRWLVRKRQHRIYERNEWAGWD